MRDKEGVSQLDSADLARRRVIRNWTRLFVCLTAVLLACSIALVPLHWKVEQYLEYALTDDIELLRNLQAPTGERLLAQFTMATTLQNERVGQPLSLEERQKNQEEIIALNVEARKYYLAQEDKLRELGANSTIMGYYEDVLRIHDSQSELELLALENSSSFYATSAEYMDGILELLGPEANLTAYVEETFYKHLDKANDYSKQRVPLFVVTWTLLGIAFVLDAIATRHIKRYDLHLIEIAKRSHAEVRSMVQVDLISIDEDTEQDGAGEDSKSSSGTLSTSFSQGLGKVEMRQTKRILLVAVLVASALLIAALAVSTDLHVNKHSAAVEDAKLIGWPMLAQLGAVVFFFADRAIALAMGSLSNVFVENGVLKADVLEVSNKFFVSSNGLTKSLSTAFPLVHDRMGLDEANEITDRLLVPATPDDSKVINQTSLTPSLHAMAAYQEAVVDAMMNAMNTTEGVPFFTNETELQLIHAAVAPFYVEAFEQVDADLLRLSDIASSEVKRRRNSDKNAAKTASGLALACLIVFILSLGAIAYSSRRLHQQARVRFNGAAWNLSRVLSDKECAALFRAYVIKQMCRETLDFCESLRATHFQGSCFALWPYWSLVDLR
ncbi:MAG: hypothetical protein MHM6MM_005884 [Cercozoa sp. M6MM]